MLKALVISSGHPPATPDTKTWLTLQQDDDFVKGIVTPEVNLEDVEVINRLVSGIPSPLAREKATSMAIEQLQQGDSSGIDRVFQLLVDEWKGLLSCVALGGHRLTVKTIPLGYSDRAAPKDTDKSIYEIKGAFQNILAISQDHTLWREFSGTHPATDDFSVSVSVIKFDDQVVGGTSPKTLIFTSPGYDLRDAGPGLTYINKSRGKFTDPVENGITNDQIRILHAYLLSIDNQLSLLPDNVATSIRSVIGPWKKSLEKKARQLNINDLDRPTLIQNFDKFPGLYGDVINCRTRLQGLKGRIVQGGTNISSDYIETNLEDLLLPKGAVAAEIDVDPKAPGKFAYRTLEIQHEGVPRYFALPLTEKGALILRPILHKLFTGDSDTRLSAVLTNNGDITVTLRAKVGGPMPLTVERTYPIAHVLSKKVIVWPDFHAKEWTSYYFYSEFALAQEDVMVSPVYADRSTGDLKTQPNNKAQILRSFADDAELKREKILIHDERKLGDDLVYEVTKSAHPVAGMEITDYEKKISCGYVFLATEQDSSEYSGIKHKTDNNFTQVVLGIDFGSNNISMSYCRRDEEAQTFKLNSHRLCLTGKERWSALGVARNSVRASDVFFLQNEPTHSNAIKSMLTLHSDARIIGGRSKLEEPVVGGIPVFEKGIAVLEATPTRITTSLNSVKTFIHYNMKWVEDDVTLANKKALLKTLLLKASAELFSDESGVKIISEVRWAFPSAMRESLRLQYQDLWTSLKRNAPIARIGDVELKIAGGETEAEAVCRYAVSKEGQALCKNEDLFIGLDVGGSTTDILVITQKEHPTLVKQSSVRFAAGELADLTARIPGFRDFLVTFCEQEQINVPGLHGASKFEPATHPYYYNLVVDAIQDRSSFSAFYGGIARRYPGLFAANVYMCGAIFYYCGQIARKVVETRNSDEVPIDSVTMKSFGKGGRMFEWLSEVYSKKGTGYLQQCFEAGFGRPTQDILIPKFSFLESIVTQDNVKCEVAKGLALNGKVVNEDELAEEIVGEDDCAIPGETVRRLDFMAGAFIEKIGHEFSVPYVKVNLEAYFSIFKQFCIARDINIELLDDNDLRKLPVESFVRNQPEFKRAMSEKQSGTKGRDFSYRPSLFMLEVRCAMELLVQKNFA